MEELAVLEGEDRAVILRKLLRLGLRTYREEAALNAYRRHAVSLSKAAEVAGVSHWEFLGLLGQTGTTFQYDREAFQEDVKVIHRLK